MRSAARKPADDPAPEPARADLDAMAVRVLDEHLAASAQVQALTARCPDPQSAALLRHALVLIADAGTHAEELRAQMKAYGQANESLEVAFQAGRDYERKLQAAPPVLRQGHRAPGKWTQNPILRSIKVVAFGALAWSGLRYAFRAHRIAAALTAVTLPVAVGAGTYVALQPGVSNAASPPAAAAPVPGWHTSASPVPSSSLAALTRPKPKHAGKGKTLLAAGGLLPVYSTAPQAASSSAPSSSQPSVQASVQVGPAQLTVSAASLDLSNILDPQVTFSITASGGGWASWRIGTAGVDLDFSQDHGVLQSGQVAWVTVTVAAGQAADGNTSQVFSVTVQGVTIQSVTVALPALVASVLPSPVVSASVIPSGL